MLLKADCLPNAVGKQPSMPLIYLERKWMMMMLMMKQSFPGKHAMFPWETLFTYISYFSAYNACVMPNFTNRACPLRVIHVCTL